MQVTCSFFVRISLVFLIFAGFSTGSAWAVDGSPPELCIQISPDCMDGAVPGERISVSGTVINCGADVLEMVQVAIGETDQIVGWFDKLEPSQEGYFFGYHNPVDCGPSSLTIIASGVNFFEYVPGDFIKYKVHDQKIVECEVPCEVEKGCTLTPGYWKTHSFYGPASYDPTWGLIGENTLFFLSGASYYEVLWTEPKGGNAYYILAHAYIAAELNVFSDATMPEDVEDAFDGAAELFSMYTPSEIGALEGGDSLRKRFVRMAETLDDYNNGYTGPGHCND